MSSPISDFTETLQRLGSPSTFAAGEDLATVRPRVNAHVHLPPNFTAFETTSQAVSLAAAQGVGVLGASNYYDYAVYGDFAALAQQQGIFPLFGLEIIALIDTLVEGGVKINDPGNPGKMYLCGKGISQFDPMPADAQALLQVIRDNDSARMTRVTDKLVAHFVEAGVHTGLDTEAIKTGVAARHDCPRARVYLQERHVAQAFQEALFAAVPETARAAVLERLYGPPPKARVSDAVGVQNDLRSFLMKAGKPAFVPDTFVDFDHAYRLILALGGIPCYPVLADGAQPITQYEASPDALVADLKRRGVPGAEFIPLRNNPDVLSRYVHTLRDAGLFITAGTEHNTRDLLPLAPACRDDVPIPDDLQEIFWEGACVVAAHQSLALRGQSGFVDAQGRLNPQYTSDNARIAAFRDLGANMLRRYEEAFS